MALKDHFHPPLSVRRHWHALHNAWATYLSSDLNRRLPPGYFAEPNVQFDIQIDVATFEEAQKGSTGSPGRCEGGWTPPAPGFSVPFTPVSDVVEVTVFNTEEGPSLAGAIELVSPANKDRAANRDAFVSKCAAYVQQGLGLVVVDVVTERRANLHDEFLARLRVPAPTPLDADLYAVSYRPVHRDEQTSLDIWPETLTVGRPLPTLPLWLRGGLCLPVDLDATYERTCQEQRITLNGT